MKAYFINRCNAVFENETIPSCGFRFADGKILGLAAKPEKNDLIIDGTGLYLAPGFIDLHVHGGAGSDFMDATPEDFAAITAFHARHGTTGMLATTLTSTDGELFACLDCYNEFVSKPYPGARLLGLHLEGPYFSFEQRGAQDPRYLRAPTPAHYAAVYARTPHIKRWSSAPELEGDAEFARFCIERGILLSMGHTSCTTDEAEAALARGYTLATHFYSGMNGVVRKNCYRAGGLVEAGYLFDGLAVEIIADGSHLPPELLKLIYKIKGVSRTALVTDCSSAAGVTGASAKIGSRKNGQPVIVKDGVAFMQDMTGFAGSVATTARLLETVLTKAGVSMPEAVKMLTKTPAGLLGLQNKGVLLPGADADLVLFSYENGRVDIKHVFIGGEPTA
jgi:N-acetylglucosamine-6-phosphate deacetylase